jgi:segregation and condensation protein A
VAQRAKNKPELKIVVSNTPEVPAVEQVPEQVEMPFAIVNGEPVTQMPKDLYIPPQAMEVFLEAFEGPLDLLLYLIRRQNLNILDIPLAEITRQYMQYIEVMTELQLELAGEYMVMAATLAEIKSRMLLPRPKVDQDGNEEDPRAELVRRLQEYERFKRAAESIDALPRLERDVWQTSAELKDRKVVRLLPTVTLQEMLLAFKDVVVRSEMFAHHHIQRERLSVRERMANVMTTLEQASFVEFVRLFSVEEGRMGVTVTFMAILELVREGLVEIVQAEPYAPIHVRAAGASRKLHVVGGNDALVGEAVVIGEPLIGDAPAVGLLTSPADLESITELVLDPNFVDDDDDEDDGPLEGVDDVVKVPSTPPPVAHSTPADELVANADVLAPADATFASTVVTFTPAVDLAPLPADSEPQLASDMVATIDPAASQELGAVVDLAAPHFVVEPVLATDVVEAVVESVLVSEPVEVTFTPNADTTPSSAADFEPATDVVAVSVESDLDDIPSSTASVASTDAVSESASASQELCAVVDLAPPPVVIEPVVAPDAVAAPVAIEPVRATDVVAAPVVIEPVVSSDAVAAPVVIEPVLATDVVAAPVELVPIAGPADATFTPTIDVAPSVAADAESATDAIAVSVESFLTDVPAPVTADLPHLVADLADAHVEVPEPAHERPVAPAQDDLPAVDVPSPSIDKPSMSAGPAGYEIAVTPQPSLTDVIVTATNDPSSAADVPAPEPPAPLADEPVVTVDPSVFDAPAITAESEPPSDEPPVEEPPAFDVEYEPSAEDLAAADQAASEEDVSLVGDTSVVGEVSFVGEESVSGGPAVEVEEFAFDELPALDNAEHADQQPAAGAQTEESDD